MRRLARLLTFAVVPVTVVGLSKLHALWNEYDYTGSSRFAWSLGYVVILWVASYGGGLPDLAGTYGAALRLSVVTTALSALGVSVLQLVTGDSLLPRFVVFGGAGALIPLFWLTGALSLRGRARAEVRGRIFVVGGDVDEAGLAAELEARPERVAQVVGTMTVADARPTAGREPLVERVDDLGANVVVLARDAQGDESIVAQAERLHEEGIRVRSLVGFYEEWLGKLPVSELERLSLMFDIGELHRERFGRVKRVVDVVVAMPGFVAFLVSIPFVLVGNVIANRGPLFYSQPRVGKNGVVFQALKFRTMRPGGTAVGEWTSEDDPRITPFGRILRLTHVDELPQTVNILRGDLSVVGPRPEQPHYVEELVEKLPFYGLRHLVTPGLTGWAQVKYGYAANEADALEKLQYDFYYLRHQGLTLDVRIIVRTLRSVLRLRGR